MANKRTLTEDQWYKYGAGAPEDAIVVIETQKARYAFNAGEVYALREGEKESLSTAYIVLSESEDHELTVIEIRDQKEKDRLASIVLGL